MPSNALLAARVVIAEAGRDALTIPLIAEREGARSVICRRRGDVATDRMRPIFDPRDTDSPGSIDMGATCALRQVRAYVDNVGG